MIVAGKTTVMNKAAKGAGKPTNNNAEVKNAVPLTRVPKIPTTGTKKRFGITAHIPNTAAVVNALSIMLGT